MKIQDFDTSKNIFLIAEIGNNHEGNFNIAKKLIYIAKKNGANAVKLQYIEPEKLVNKDIYPDRYNFLKKICLTLNEIIKLKKYAKKINIIFLCSIFSYKKINKLTKSLPAFKIASSENNLIDEIIKFGKYKKPILFSTGLINFKNIKKNFEILKKKIDKKKICILHCVSDYPLDYKNANLEQINLLKKLHSWVGYSDHTIGIEACIAAATLGARVIEKHFTLDHNYSSFRDHELSMDPGELKMLSESLRRVNLLLKKPIPEISNKNIKNNRRGLYAAIDIEKGQVIKKDNIILLRPQKQLGYEDLKKIIGKKSKFNIKKFEQLNLKKIFRN